MGARQVARAQSQMKDRANAKTSMQTALPSPKRVQTNPEFGTPNLARKGWVGLESESHQLPRLVQNTPDEREKLG